MAENSLKQRSRALTDGSSRAGARAMLRAAGLKDEDFSKPLIGIANTWIEIGPCNYHLRELAVHVRDGIRAAGGTPLEFNTVSISDGITMGTEGMRTSLISREIIADSIELVTRGNMFDAIVVLVGCDKTIPGGAMALARLEYSWPHALWRLNRSRTLRRQSRHHSRRLRGNRRSRQRKNHRPATERPGMFRLSRAQAPAAGSSPPTPWLWSANSSASLQWESPAFPPQTKAKRTRANLPENSSSICCARMSLPRKFSTKSSIENAIAGVGRYRGFHQRRAPSSGHRA